MDNRLAGRTFVVTGATSGIGYSVAGQLLAEGAAVYGVGRTPERCQQAQAALAASHPGGKILFLQVDLSLQSEVRRLAEVLSGKLRHLDGLVNNAGVFTLRRELTSEGFETQWAVNHLAPFLLTHTLLPLLQAAVTGRVVTVSSGSHYHTRLAWNDLQLSRHYNGLLAYKRTKLCNVLFSAELNRRLGKGSSVRAFAADPGLVYTDMGFKHNPGFARWIWRMRRAGGITADESARGVVFLATDPSIQAAAEVYWKHGVVKAPNPLALDPAAAGRLWDLSAAMCGLE